MFCEKCGTQIDANQSFCPTCGNRVNVSGYSASQSDSSGGKLTLDGAMFEKLNAMEKMEQLYYVITAGLLVVCFILAMLKVYSSAGVGVSLADAASFLLVVATMYFTIAIGLVILEYLDKLQGLWIWFFLVCGAALILLLYVIIWIAGVQGVSLRLSVGGWFFLVFQAGLTASSVLLLIEKLKNRK